MGKIFCLLTAIGFIFYSPAYAANRPKDFQGVPWGTHVSKVEGLVPKKEALPAYLPREFLEKINKILRESEEKGRKTFIRAADILQVPGGEVRSVEYIFVEDRLVQGLIYFDDYPQHLNFMKIFARLYGAPENVEKDESMIRHSWHAKIADEGDVTLFYNPLIKAGYVSMNWKEQVKKESGSILGDAAGGKAGEAK